MTDLKEAFERLGLSQYLEAFVAEGFDSWQTVADVSEADLVTLNVKLGHRRKLQRAISDWRRETGTVPLSSHTRRGSIDGSYRSDESDNDLKSTRGREANATAAPQSTKRKYRRHPKPDEHAPERPPSAYVIFSNQVRETLKGQDHSFSEIAKIVGERWQVLSPAARESCDKQAAAAKEKYYQELAEYKKTPRYAHYQVYLAEFKAKYNTSSAGREEGKRSKLESEPSMSGIPGGSGASDKADRSHGRRKELSTHVASHQRQSSAEYCDPIARQHRHAQPPDASAIPRSLPDMRSPQMLEQFSPASISPASGTPLRDQPFVQPAHGHDIRERHPELGASSPGYMTTTTSPSPSHMLYDATHDRRHYPSRDPPELLRADSSVPSVPSLARTETTMSSMSGTSRQGSAVSVPSLPPFSSLDTQKAHRTLPQPVPTVGVATAGHTDAHSSGGIPTRLASTEPTTQPHERRSGLDALLRATEMVGVNSSNQNRNPGPPGDRPP